jgi:hypothetical protein
MQKTGANEKRCTAFFFPVCKLSELLLNCFYNIIDPFYNIIDPFYNIIDRSMRIQKLNPRIESVEQCVSQMHPASVAECFS